MKSKDLLYWIWFAQAMGPANGDSIKLLKHYENPYEIYRCVNDSHFPKSLMKYIYYVPLYVKFLREEGADFDEKLFEHLELNKNFCNLVFNKRK